jgi:hypothetical protein
MRMHDLNALNSMMIHPCVVRARARVRVRVRGTNALTPMDLTIQIYDDPILAMRACARACVR